MGFLWNDLMINPMINGLIILSRLLFGNFGLAIIVFTIIVRVVTVPLTLRQLRAGRRMQALQPKLQEIQKKYTDPKRRSEETMKLYRQEGVNPVGCLGPMLIQMPILFALYAVLTRTVGGTPESLASLSQRLYSWSFIHEAVPLATQFLWLDLGRPDGTYLMVVLVFITTWLQTKLTIGHNMSGTQMSAQMQQTNQMMLWMMPVITAWFSINFPSGLALYWTIGNIIGIVTNYFVYGWHEKPLSAIFAPASPKQTGPRKPVARGRATPARAALAEEATTTTTPPVDGAVTRQSDAQSGNKRKERRGGAGQGSSTARTRPNTSRRRGR